MASLLPTEFRRVALIHDWLTGMRGGEQVLEQFIKLFPQADIFTIVADESKISASIRACPIVESPIVKLPFGRTAFRSYLPLFPWAIESFELKGYQLILSSSHCVAKGVIPPPDALHISYVHSPMRYVWDMRSEYLGEGAAGPIKRHLGGFAAHYLRAWDVNSSKRVDRFVANSGHVRRRIQQYYRREADVVYPPVEIDRFEVGAGGGGYFITVSALVPYKRVDLAIMACEQLGLKLKVVGDGPEYARLRDLAGANTEFTGPLSWTELRDLYRGSLALIHAGEEDFGIAPLEAQASGRPVIGYGRGGVLETVIADGEQRTGLFFREPTVKSLSEALRSFEPERFNPMAARTNAERFGSGRFREEIATLVEKNYRLKTAGEFIQ
jgi:glycosyltransferase involved in cell wall biosynthesis